MNRAYLRFLWSHERWLHRFAVRLYNRAMGLVPFGPKYGIGLAMRRNQVPYSLVRPGSVVVQVGAPRDTLLAGRSRAMYFSLLAGESGCVVAVEPDGASVSHTENFLRKRGIKNFRIFPTAAWSETTTLRIYVSHSHPASSFTEGSKEYDDRRISAYHVVEVPAKSIDALLAEEEIAGVDLVSITTNGAEREILEGMKETIARGLPYISLARTGTGYLEMMDAYGYELFAHDDRGFTFRRRQGPSSGRPV